MFRNESAKTEEGEVASESHRSNKALARDCGKGRKKLKKTRGAEDISTKNLSAVRLRGRRQERRRDERRKVLVSRSRKRLEQKESAGYLTVASLPGQ